MTITQPRVADGIVVYAIGDIHGHLDILKRLMAKIVADVATHPDLKPILVFVGDYVDRGPDSRGVIDYLLNDLPEHMEKHFLRGNHEDVFLRFLDGEVSLAESWLQFGGAACLASYGVNPFRPGIRQNPGTLIEEMLEKFPETHRTFLDNTEFYYENGDYYFTHAGVRADLPLEEQQPRDLMWVREPFLSNEKDYGKVIVHGHTIVDTPEIHANRIAIDTGAYATGQLTALRLLGDQRHFIST